MEQKSGCLYCGKELLYLDRPESCVCIYCKGTFSTQARCVDNHFVCDACHSLSANDLIERFTNACVWKDPLEMAITLMKSPSVKMHGPEHHFLVPAVLLSAFYNVKGEPAEKAGRIAKARQRAEHVLGGFCGFYGNCGAAVGTGIFMSVVTGATPLSTEEWRLSNLLTARSLHTIAEAGGPRCCKRDSFLAIQEARRFTKDRLGIEMDVNHGRVRCDFHYLNKECKKAECGFYPS
ncbi:MAG: DUF5714 domain-containing protein [Syntrophorhabdales bacterium]|jgi:hypothetical protein